MRCLQNELEETIAAIHEIEFLLSDIEINHTRQFSESMAKQIIELSESVVGAEKVRSILNGA